MGSVIDDFVKTSLLDWFTASLNLSNSQLEPELDESICSTLNQEMHKWLNIRYLTKNDLRCAAAICRGAMCGSKLQCACRIHFHSNLRCVCMQCILRLAMCNQNIAHYFGNTERTLLSFGVSYNFVDQKWRILAIFHKKIKYTEVLLLFLGLATDLFPQ